MNRLGQTIREQAVPLSFAFLAFFVHCAVNLAGGYDYFRDEFYYIACSSRLDWGYVDHPPLSIFLLFLNRLLLGDSITALRFLPAVASGVLVFLAALLVRSMNGGKTAEFFACLSVVIAPIYLILGDFYSMNAFEGVFWMSCAVVLIRILGGGNERYWLLFGLLAGLGLQNKHSMAFFGVAVVIGLLASDQRKILLSKWIWLGGGIAVLCALPNVVWQIIHDWPTLEFTQNAQQHKNLPMSPVEYFAMQVLLQHPLTLPLWLAGLGAFFMHPDLKRFKTFSIAYVFLFALYVVQRGKPYYLSPFYPVLLAGGAVVFEQFVRRPGRHWLRSTYASILVITGVATIPLFLPVLPVETYARLAGSLGLADVKTERHDDTRLPQVFADRFGWREMTATVARIYGSLPAEEQSRAVIYTQNYGEAGAIDFFGGHYGLPKAISGHNSYWMWGPGLDSAVVAIIVGGRAADHATVFESVEAVAVHRNPYAMPHETNLTIFLCRNPKHSLQEIWHRTKIYG